MKKIKILFNSKHYITRSLILIGTSRCKCRYQYWLNCDGRECACYLVAEWLCWAQSFSRVNRSITVRCFFFLSIFYQAFAWYACAVLSQQIDACNVTMMLQSHNNTTHEFRLLTMAGHLYSIQKLLAQYCAKFKLQNPNRNPWENGQSCWYILLGFAISAIQE